MPTKMGEIIGLDIGADAPNTDLKYDLGTLLKPVDRTGDEGAAIDFPRSLG
ncbi:MAG: hypothetical protein AAF390_04570 [Pseudomonadota bacterium]